MSTENGCKFVYRKLKIFLLSLGSVAAVLTFLVACDNDPVSPDKNTQVPIDNLDKSSNWFGVDNSKYNIANAYVVSNPSDTQFASSAASSGITLATQSGLPLMTIAIIGQTIPTGTWTLPSENAYMMVLGHNSKLYFFIPISAQNYLLSDKCKDAQTMISGSLTISKTDTVYEIKVQNAKLTTTIHQTTEVDDPHPAGTVTVNAYYKGAITVSQTQPTGDCGNGIVLPQRFLIKYDNILTDQIFAGIDGDFYDGNDGFYKKVPPTWKLYEKNSDSVWVCKKETICPYKQSILIWDPSNESVYTTLPSEVVLGVTCRKYTYKFSDTTAVTYWIHPDYDIVMKYQSNMIISLTNEVTSFSTTFSSWQEIGLTKP